MRRTGLLMVALVVVSGVIGACAGDSDGGDGASALPEQGEHKGFDDGTLAAAQPAARPQDFSGAGGAATGVAEDSELSAYGSRVGSSLLRTPAIGPSVIKTADVEVEVKRGDFQDALNQSIGLAGRYGGFVVSTTIDGEDHRSGSVVLRIPAEDFERVLASLEGLGEVHNEVVSGRDVSQEFIDLDARIRNFESQEAVLLRLMAQTNSIGESIRVQHELQSVRLEIERLQGRLRYLRNQAAMSTISMRLIEAGAAPTEPPKIGVLGKAWDQAIAGALAVVSAVIVGAGIALPIAVMIAIALVLLRVLRPKFGSAA